MKKLLVLANLLLLLSVGKSIAGQADLFTYDAVAIENQMAQLDRLEGFVLANPGVTLGQITSDGSSLISLASDPNGINGINLTNEQVFGIPGFFWGCLLSVPGVLIVYLIGQDQHETKMAIIGCLIEGVIWGSCSLIWNVGLGHSFWW
ncbi:MAG: hypothetical protein PHY99_00885 [Bacteroidales bacterium]|nr:hypothetical protein [Bacteroidales bacterium]